MEFISSDNMKITLAPGQEELLSTPETIRKIRALLQESGATDELLLLIAQYTDQALHSLASLPESSYRQLLVELTASMLDRNV